MLSSRLHEIQILTQSLEGHKGEKVIALGGRGRRAREDCK